MGLSNKEIFKAELIKQLAGLFENDNRYTYIKNKMTPTELGAKMMLGLNESRSTSIDGPAIIATCKKLSIKQTYIAINSYLFDT